MKLNCFHNIVLQCKLNYLKLKRQQMPPVEPSRMKSALLVWHQVIEKDLYNSRLSTVL